MGLVSTWLTGIGLSSAVPTFHVRDERMEYFVLFCFLLFSIVLFSILLYCFLYFILFCCTTSC